MRRPNRIRGMEQNPYEAPREPSGLQNKTVSIMLRVLAIVAWIICPLPAIAFVAPLLVFGIPEGRQGIPIAFYFIGAAFFILPALGLALLGAALWWRIRWMGIAGLAAVAPLVVILLIAIIRSR
jgi:hypothetical protein